MHGQKTKKIRVNNHSEEQLHRFAYMGWVFNTTYGNDCEIMLDLPNFVNSFEPRRLQSTENKSCR